MSRYREKASFTEQTGRRLLETQPKQQQESLEKPVKESKINFLGFCRQIILWTKYLHQQALPPFCFFVST